jgi:hypothetical protein
VTPGFGLVEGDTFPEAVRDQLDFLIVDNGFRPVREDESSVRLESATVGVEAQWDRRGEVEVRAFRIGRETWVESWSWSGMVGQASVRRLLEMAGERLLAEPKALLGDSKFFEDLEIEKRRESEAWTAYYSHRGPHPPRKGKLP